LDVVWPFPFPTLIVDEEFEFLSIVGIIPSVLPVDGRVKTRDGFGFVG
jgi:hypothetical protein